MPIETRADPNAVDELKHILRTGFLGGDASAVSVRPEQWSEVAAAAVAHGMSSLLYSAGRRLRLFDAAPGEIAASMRMQYMHQMQRGASQQAALAEILAKFAAADLKVVVMKGAALSALLYHDPALRPMLDIDLLVERDALPAVHAVLSDLGYRRVEKTHRPDFVLSGSIEVDYVRDAPTRQALDLHWDVLVPSFGAASHTPMFWSQSRSVTIAGQPALAFTNEAMLLHLAIHHYLHHSEESLMRMFDAALLVHRCGAEMNWPLLRSLADEMALQHMVERMLREVEELWGVSNAEGRAVFAADPSRAPRASIDALHSPVRHLSIGAAMPSMRSGAEYLFRQTFPLPSYMRQRYGMRRNWHLPFYYAMRFGRGLQQLGGHLLRRR